jgi:hypothetical protein
VITWCDLVKWFARKPGTCVCVRRTQLSSSESLTNTSWISLHAYPRQHSPTWLRTRAISPVRCIPCNGGPAQMLRHGKHSLWVLRNLGGVCTAASHSCSSGVGGQQHCAAVFADVSRSSCRSGSTAAAADAARSTAAASSAAYNAAAAAASGSPGRHYLPASTAAVLLPPSTQLTLTLSHTHGPGPAATQILVSCQGYLCVCVLASGLVAPCPLGWVQAGASIQVYMHAMSTCLCVCVCVPELSYCADWLCSATVLQPWHTVCT